MLNKEEVKKSYYYTDIEPTLDRLNTILNIAQNFESEGASRLMCALNMKHMDILEVERLGVYIAQARDKMEKELVRVRKYEKDFNAEFATDHNGYYNSVKEMLKHIRSHMSPLKTIFRKFCYRKQPSKSDMEFYNIPRQSVFDKSVLGMGIYQPDLFDIADYPAEVQGLFTEMQKFFEAEVECMDICTSILEEELRIMKDPVQSKYLLDKYRRKAFEKLKNQIMLISDDVIENLKSLSPAYQRLCDYASEEGFAQGEFHKHNTADMDHFCLIEIATKNKDITNEEKALWGDNPSLVKKIRYVIKHFDELLPRDFKHKLMGYYEYVFCMWALPGNIKRATEYFIKHYNGAYKTSKYAAVNKQSVHYHKDSDDVKDFIKNINLLLSASKQPELMSQSA